MHSTINPPTSAGGRAFACAQMLDGGDGEGILEGVGKHVTKQRCSRVL